MRSRGGTLQEQGESRATRYSWCAQRRSGADGSRRFSTTYVYDRATAERRAENSGATRAASRAETSAGRELFSAMASRSTGNVSRPVNEIDLAGRVDARVGASRYRHLDGTIEQSRERRLQHSRDRSQLGLILESVERGSVVLDDDAVNGSGLTVAKRCLLRAGTRSGTFRFSSRSRRSAQATTSVRSGATWLRSRRSTASPSLPGLWGGARAKASD